MKEDVIAERLDNLKGMVIEFKELNSKDHANIMKKQDHTNGTVCQHEGEIAKIKTQHAETLAYIKGMLKALTWVAIVTPCIIGTLFAVYVKNLRYEITKEIYDVVTYEIDQNNALQFDDYIKK